MRKQLLNLKFLLMLCMIFCIGGGSVAFAEEVTVNFKTNHSISSSNLSYLEGNVTFNFTKGTNNYPAFNSNDPSLRIYYGAKFTISVPEGCTMSSIQLTYRQDKTANKVTADVGTYSANEGTTYKTSTWTGDANSVTFSIAGTSGHIRLQTVVVTYSTGSTPTATLTGISVSGTATDLWKGDVFTHEGITVTATYDDGNTADVTNSCSYSDCDMSTAGSQTVTVSYGGKEATYTVNVKTIGNTQENAYTASEAIELFDAGKDLKTPVYVKGKVSEIATAWTESNGYLSFWVSEDGKENKFEMYKNYKGANNEKYASEDECPNVGDDVICYGQLTKFNTTYELNAGNYLVEKTVSTAQSSNLTLSQTTGEVNVGNTLDISGYVSTAEGYTGTVTYAVTTGAEYASVSENGVITGLAEGTATVKVTAPAVVGAYSESSAEFSVTVVDNRTATNVTFGKDVDDQTFSVNLREKFEGKTATVSPTEAGTVTYSSDNKEVASVDENTGAITIGNTAGTATITASFAATDDYKASSAKYYINVIDPNGPVFYESFDNNKGEGGNDGTWSNISQKPTLMYDNSGWADENENGSGADKCAIFGISSAKGTATTPAIDLSGDKYILTFKAGAWDATREKTTIDVKISKGTLTYNGTSSSTQTIEMNKGEWTDYTMTIAGATNNATITFTARVASNNRFFLDEVKIVKAQTPEPTTSGDLTFKAQDSDGMYYATFSSNKDVVFTNGVIVSAVSVADNKLSIKDLTTGCYEVTDATVGEGTGIVEDGYYVPKNNGVLISCTDASAKYYFPKAEQTNVALTANQLKAAPAGGGKFTAEAGHVYYKLAYNNYDEKTGLGFYLGAADGGAFSVKAGTAYLAVPSKSETNNVKGFSFDGTSTGVSAVDAEEPAKTRVIYNIAGQKVNAMTKAGLYIVNGKKIVIRK